MPFESVRPSEFSSSCSARKGSPMALVNFVLSIKAKGAALCWDCSTALYAVCQYPSFLASLALCSQDLPIAVVRQSEVRLLQ